MKIYLLRHAIAEKRNISKFPNDDRPLSKKGRQQMKEIAFKLASLCGKIDRIYCSPLKRSVETAEIFKVHSAYKKKIYEIKELLPEASPQKFLRLISKLNPASAILLVGHEPFLSNLLSGVTGLNQGSLDFKKAGFSLIMLEKNKSPVLKFFIPPKLLIRLDAE